MDSQAGKKKTLGTYCTVMFTTIEVEEFLTKGEWKVAEVQRRFLRVKYIERLFCESLQSKRKGTKKGLAKRGSSSFGAITSNLRRTEE